MVDSRSFWTRWRKFALDLQHTMRASGLYGQAGRLYSADRVQEAVSLLQKAIALVEAAAPVGTPKDSFLIPHQLSVRMCSVFLLAQAAPRVGDQQLASASIRDGLAMWAEAKLSIPQLRANEAFGSWEKWARSYMAWLERQR